MQGQQNIKTSEDVNIMFIASHVNLRIPATSVFQTIMASALSGKLLKPEDGLHGRWSLLRCYTMPTGEYS